VGQTPQGWRPLGWPAAGSGDALEKEKL
jgi:hypothetical protein